MSTPRNLSSLDRELGIDASITRRDFLNGALLGAGAMLLDLSAPAFLLGQRNPDWDGYGGVGDYARSNGNTWEVMHAAHEVRDGAYDKSSGNVVETGETYDLVIVGGGISGLMAALKFLKNHKTGQKCLVLENHPIFGGEAKQNEFRVNGERLIGPQGSNAFVVPPLHREPTHGIHEEMAAAQEEAYTTLGIPREFEHQTWDPKFKPMDFARDNYAFLLWADRSPNNGFFFDEAQGVKPHWAHDIWANDLKDTPFSDKVKRDLLLWRNSRQRYYAGEDFERWLDTMNYRDYIEKVMKLDRGVTRYADPIIASGIGAGCDGWSAYHAFNIGMPGFLGFTPGRQDVPVKLDEMPWLTFPGGNSGIARYFLKYLIPESIEGGKDLTSVITQSVNFEALDRPQKDVRVRVGCTVARVEHEGRPESSKYVSILYAKNGHAYHLRARAVVMASGSWINQYVVRDMPQEQKAACKTFPRNPVLSVNVAVTNWRFLYNLGLTACRWFDGFGFSCNIRRPMIMDNYKPPLDPDKPTLVTFYMAFYYPDLPIAEQGNKGREELLSASYLDLERKIRAQMQKMFRMGGFDAKRDIAGIILNRWGHAYAISPPGTFFGTDGKPPVRDILKQRFGRISFGHSEQIGSQHWPGAAAEGGRAAVQAMELL